MLGGAPSVFDVGEVRRRFVPGHVTDRRGNIAHIQLKSTYRGNYTDLTGPRIILSSGFSWPHLRNLYGEHVPSQHLSIPQPFHQSFRVTSVALQQPI